VIGFIVRRLLAAIPLLLAASCTAVNAGMEIELAPYSSGEESPLADAGGYVKGYSPLAWGDTTLPLMTPSLSVLAGRVVAMEGFLHPEPANNVMQEDTGNAGAEGDAHDAEKGPEPPYLRWAELRLGAVVEDMAEQVDQTAGNE